MSGNDDVNIANSACSRRYSLGFLYIARYILSNDVKVSVDLQ